MKGPAQLLLIIFLSSFVLERCDGIFKINFQLLKLPRFGFPLNFEILFGPDFPVPGRIHRGAAQGLGKSGNSGSTRSALVSLGRKPSIVFREHHDDHHHHHEDGDYEDGGGGGGESGDVAQFNIPSYDEIDQPNQHLDATGSDYSNDEMLVHMKTLDKQLTIGMNKTRQSSSITEHAMRPANGSGALSFLPDLSVLKQLFQWTGQSAKSFALCHACKVGIGLFMMRARSGASPDNLIQTAIFGCKFFKIAPDEMCDGLVHRFGPTLLFIVNERSQLSADMFCGVILQSVGCITKDPMIEWNVLNSNIDYSVPREKPVAATVKRENSRHQILDSPTKIPSGTKFIKILHLTDLHVDPHYRAGFNANCEKEMCCRSEDLMPDDPVNGAGFYGDYRKCDLPYHSFENALAHISSTHPDIKLIYMTGDIVPHNVWSTDPDENMEIIFNCSNLIHKYFPNTTILNVLGNHETHPVNLFSPYGVPPRFSTDWVYATTAKAWSRSIPKESLNNFLYGGFYDKVISPKFRVIVLNTNLCYTYNFWLMYDDKDPSGQLRWLTIELQKSQDIGQKVHILGHVPPGQEDCWAVWSKNFYEIISRFSSTVKAQFYGHTHYDEFKLFYHPRDKGVPISPIWIGASLTPYTNLNPGYKIFTVDGGRGDDSTWSVVDHETWIYNLSKANTNPSKGPQWFRLYKATEAYGLPDVLPSSLNRFVHRMSSNITDFNRYYWHYHKAAHLTQKGRACDSLCRKRILCNIVTPYQKQQTECMLLQSELDGVILPMRIFENKRPGSDMLRLPQGRITDEPDQGTLSLPSTTESSLSTDQQEDDGNNNSNNSKSPSPSFFDRIFGPS